MIGKSYQIGNYQLDQRLMLDGFSKRQSEGQHSMVNRQRLTPRFTATLSQPLATQNTFGMTFLITSVNETC